MIDNREALLDELKDILAVYAKRVEMEEGKLSDASESFYCGLLNAVLGGNLKNMNRERPNFPAIDLGDDAPVAVDGKAVRLAVQITSTGTRQKVRHTLDEFFENELEKRFNRLVVLVTGKADSFKEEPKLPVVFDFDTKRDVWSEKKLLDRIRDLPDDRFGAVADYVHSRLTMPGRKPAMNLPLQSAMRAENFVGREEELREIARRFEKEQVVVLCGLGGMGKTELAVRFGRNYEESGRGWAYFMRFSGSFRQTLRENVTGILPGYSREGRTEAQIEGDALAALSRCGREDLLILDNADEGSMTALRRELSALRMRVLVTSRQEPEQAMELGRLSEDALFDIFRRHGAELEEAEMRELIEAVDGHTMTVELMARLLRRERRTDTLTRLKKALSQRDLASGEFGKTESAYGASSGQARINEHLKAVFRVSDMGRAEKTVLRFATLLGESGLDSEMFAKAAEPELKPAPAEPVKRRWFDIFRRKTEEKPIPVPKIRDLLQELADKGWLLWKKDDIRIHPVIRIVCMEVLKPTEENCEDFLDGIRAQYDEKQYDHAKFRQMAEVFETASNILEDKTGFWAGEAGYFWLTLSETRRALDCNLRSVEKTEQHQPDSNNLAASYNNVGATYDELGDHKQALEYKRKALSIRERVLPPDHPDLALSYNNVGYSYDELGDHEKALEYQRKALSILERVLPPDYPSLAISYGNVGASYRALGEPQKALPYELKVISIFEKVLPQNHPHLATSYNNVGATYDELGDHKQALEYKRKALSIWERVLPPDHPDLAISYNNVGGTYRAMGDHEKTLEYVMKAHRIRERVLPGNHPDLAISYNNVGTTYGALGDHEKALEYKRKALSIWERVLPGNHPSLALSFNNIAWTYRDLGRLDEAAEHMRRAADIINRSTLPENHPQRVNYNKWAEELEAEARQEEAE